MRECWNESRLPGSNSRARASSQYGHIDAACIRPRIADFQTQPMRNSSLDSRLASYEPWVRLMRRGEGIPEELVCLSIVESLSIHKLFACGARGSGRS
jgi:hypothetical protein